MIIFLTSLKYLITNLSISILYSYYSQDLSNIIFIMARNVQCNLEYTYIYVTYINVPVEPVYWCVRSIYIMCV